MAQKGKVEKAGAVLRCTKCGHLESEHALRGLRPCMAVVGELLKREFCPCEEFRLDAALAA